MNQFELFLKREKKIPENVRNEKRKPGGKKRKKGCRIRGLVVVGGERCCLMIRAAEKKKRE